MRVLFFNGQELRGTPSTMNQDEAKFLIASYPTTSD